MKPNAYTQQSQQGMTLVELMVAMVIGLLITLAVSALFLSSRQSYQENEAAARMQENARFAIELITQDLRHAGFFGDVPDPMDIAINDGTIGNAGNGCAGGLYTLYDATTLRYRVMEYGNQINDATGTPFADCLIADEAAPDTSMLTVKRVETPPTADADLVANRVYIHANGANGELARGNSISLTGGDNRGYLVRTYYVDTDFMLRRTEFSSQDQLPGIGDALAEGIEAFHIEFGIDLDLDGTPDSFYSPAANAVGDATLNGAVTATVYVLARTLRPDNNYQDSKTYNLGSEVYGPFNDGFHRRVFSATTVLRNLRNQVTLRL